MVRLLGLVLDVLDVLDGRTRTMVLGPLANRPSGDERADPAVERMAWAALKSASIRSTISLDAP